MSGRPRALLILLLAATAAALGAQTPQEPQFRGGTNLVRLDVYVARDGVAVTDLTAADFEVLEDNAPQQVTSFELIQPRGPVPDSVRVEPSTVAEARARAAQPDTRLFVLFLDTLHVQLEGSYRAQNPVAALLDRVVGEDDLVGVMTPEISARNVTFSPRTSSIDRLLSLNWAWGQRDRTPQDPREQQLDTCYPDDGGTAGIARALIERRREQQTLRALDDLVDELERQREERTFVLLLTEGWLLPRADNELARRLEWPGGSGVPGGRAPIGAGPDGRLAAGGGRESGMLQSCERERSLLALADLEMEFQQLMRRANRANVSFYPIDPRGLVAFDEPIGPRRPLTPTQDARRLTRRQEGLRSLADETDGTVVLGTDIERALPRLLTDVGAYYLLGYVSTNQKLDGRYRRLTVRVRRPDVTVRARPGYLAPTASEVTAGRQTSVSSSSSSASSSSSSATSSSSPEPAARVQEALSRLPTGRTTPPMYLNVAGGSGFVQITVELDRATAGAPEYRDGAAMRVEVGPADAIGAVERAAEERTVEPGTRVVALRHPDRDLLAPGRYQVRAQVSAKGARTLTLSTVVVVPPADALIGSAAMAARRGPGTGRLFQPTADARFRRTERLQVETPLLAPDATVTARLLNRVGQPMAVPVTMSERLDESLQLRVAVAELALAPLAPGEYVVEMTAAKGDATASVDYGFRIIP